MIQYLQRIILVFYSLAYFSSWRIDGFQVQKGKVVSTSKIFLGSTIKSVKIDPRNINKEIIRFFSYQSLNDSDFRSFQYYIQQRKLYLNQVNIITLLHRCGKKKLDIFSIIDIDSVVHGMMSAKASAQGISNAFYGIQHMNSESKEIPEILNALRQQLQNNNDFFDVQSISGILYGLRKFNCDSPHVREILISINEKLTMYNDSKYMKIVSYQQVESQSIGMALYGLQGMTTNEFEVTQILDNIANFILPKLSALDPQALANSLEGLKGCCSEHESTRKILNGIAQKLLDQPKSLHNITSKEVSMTLHGLQSMSSDHDEVRTFLSALCEVLERSNWLGKVRLVRIAGSLEPHTRI